MRKKICIGGGVFMSILMFMTAAFAATVSQDYSSNTVTVSGEVEANRLVSIQVLKEGMSVDDLVNADDPAQLVIYADQTSADENGKFSFEFDYDGKSGIYNAYIASKLWNEPQKAEIYFVNREDYVETIDKLNAAADKNVFYNIIKDNLTLFRDEVTVENIYLESAMGRMYDYTRKEPLDVNDSVRTQKIYNTFTVIEGINEKKVSNAVQYMDYVLVPQDIEEWLKKVQNDSRQEGSFNTRMMSKQLSTVEEFQKAIKESVILAVVEYPGGTATAKKIMQDYAAFIGLNTGKPDETYANVAGNHYGTLSDLADAFNNSGNGGSGSSGGNGSSGSTGGRGGSGTSGALVGPSYNVNTGKSEKVTKIFTDIDSVAWANEAICALADKGIINGKTESEFCPDDFVTREEFVKMIIGAMGIPVDGKENVFSDVDDNMWYAPYVKTAYEKKIIQGIGDGRFGIGSNITRQDMAVIASNVSGLNGKPKKRFIDEAEISAYALDSVNALLAAGIINGDENFAFNPKNNSTRAEAAKIVYELYKYMN